MSKNTRERGTLLVTLTRTRDTRDSNCLSYLAPKSTRKEKKPRENKAKPPKEGIKEDNSPNSP